MCCPWLQVVLWVRVHCSQRLWNRVVCQRMLWLRESHRGLCLILGLWLVRAFLPMSRSENPYFLLKSGT